jgi:hypothetical protein
VKIAAEMGAAAIDVNIDTVRSGENSLPECIASQ